MDLLKRNWLVLAILVLAVAMVLIRTCDRNSFRYDAVRWAAPSADGTNLISADNATGTGDKFLIICLGSTAGIPAQFKDRAVMILPAEMLGKENLKLIRKNRGPVLLYSDDGSVSARVWMVLSEMGIRNIYILRDNFAETP